MYTGFAEVYDELMNDVDYEDWADFYCRMMEAFGIRRESCASAPAVRAD
jgi:hypothetical protein